MSSHNYHIILDYVYLKLTPIELHYYIKNYEKPQQNIL